jgi:hypothetical protein
MDPKHTQGPWDAYIDDDPACAHDSILIHAGGSEIAEVRNVDDFPCLDPDDYGTVEHEAKANALLIAAAPEMYDALQAITGWLMRDESGTLLDDSHCWNEDFRKALELTKKSLAKAEGR